MCFPKVGFNPIDQSRLQSELDREKQREFTERITQAREAARVEEQRQAKKKGFRSTIFSSYLDDNMSEIYKRAIIGF
jgi:hypothetical protein